MLRSVWLYKRIINKVLPKGSWGNTLNRKEAVTLFTELIAEGHVHPSFVLIEQRKPDKFQLKIKGSFDRQEIELRFKNKGFSFEESQDFLIIFKL